MKKSSPKQQNTRSSSDISEQITYDQQKKRKFYIKQIVYVLYFIARIAVTIAILFTLTQNFIQKLTDTDSFKRMQENISLWKLDVIVNITTINSYNCPEGYQTYTSYNWPGTKEGCYCYASLGTWDFIKILQGACSQAAMGAGCVRVDKINPIPFLFWKKDELICLKRVKNLDFFTDLEDYQIPQAATTKCSANQKYRFDIPSVLTSSLCPLTELQNNNILHQQLGAINFSFDRQSNYPIVKLKMTQYQFCPDLNKDNISPFKQRNRNYNLQNVDRQSCDGIDPRVQVIDQIGQDELFQNNPRILDAVSALPAYPIPMSDYRYKLGTVRYPEWTYSCRKSLQFNLLATQAHFNLQQISSYTLLCLDLSIIFSVIFGFIFSLYYIYRKIVQIYYRHQQKVLYDTLPQIEKKKPNLYQKLHKKFVTQLLIFIAKFLVSVSILIIIVVFHEQITKYSDWYLGSRSCTSQIMKQWIQSGYINYFEQQQKNLLLTIILVLILMIIDLLMFFWRNFKGDLKVNSSLTDQQITNIFDEQNIHKDNQNQKHLDIKTINQEENENQFKIDKEIQLAEFSKPKRGKIRKNQKNQIKVNHNEISLTEEQLIEEQNPTESIHGSTIARPKRPERRKRLISEEESLNQTEEWDI